MIQENAILEEPLLTPSTDTSAQDTQDVPHADPDRAYWAFNQLVDVSKYFRAYCYRSVVDLGFSRNEIDVLMSLTEHPEKNTVKGISETVHISKGMISQAVESLRKKKFVTVNPDEKDRRSVLISLSNMATPVLDRLKEASAAFVQKIISGIPYEELQQVYSVVTRVYANKENMRSVKPQSGEKKLIGGAANAAENYDEP